MTSSGLLHLAVILIPGAVALLERGRNPDPATRGLALHSVSLTFLLSLALLGLAPGGKSVSLQFGETELVLLNELNVWLMPYTLVLYLAILLCTPRADRSPGGTRRLLLGLTLDLTFFSLGSPLAMALLWPLTHLPLLGEIRGASSERRRLTRILGFYLIPGCLCFTVGSLALAFSPEPPLWALLAITVGIALRKALVPLHQWLPDLFERGPLGHTIAFCTPQLGAYATLHLLAPSAPDALLTGLGAAALVTSVYGACLAFGQTSVRGAYAGLVMGQTALVFAGLQLTTRAGLAGGLALWISGGLALTGLGLMVWALESRRGPLKLNTYQGGHDLSPVLATSFLILGLTCVGFPGTLGFVSQEMLLHGTTHVYPLLGILAAVTTTLNGITIMRLYLCMFCGKRVPFTISQSLRRRERVAMLLLVALLVGFGLLPQTFVASRWRAAQAIVELRKVGREH